MNDEIVYQDLIDRNKVPRKYKLAWLGRKTSKSKIRKDIKKFQQGHLFIPCCHVCGCFVTYTWIDTDVEYPEAYEKEHCLRCETVISVVDNSPRHYIANDILIK